MPAGAGLVQVGAFSNSAEAESTWNDLAKRFGFLASLNHKTIEGTGEGGRKIFRLNAVAANAAAARGSGRASARETVCRVVGGAFAMQLLKHYGVHIHAWTSSIGPVTLPDTFNPDFNAIYQNDVRTCHQPTADAMRQHIEDIRITGDSCGGAITCVIQNLPAGIGEKTICL